MKIFFALGLTVFLISAKASERTLEINIEGEGDRIIKVVTGEHYSRMSTFYLNGQLIHSVKIKGACTSIDVNRRSDEAVCTTTDERAYYAKLLSEDVE